MRERTAGGHVFDLTGLIDDARYLAEMAELRWATVAALRIGNIYREAGKSDESQKWFRSIEYSLRGQPESPWLREMRAIAGVSMGIIENSREKPAEAIALLRPGLGEIAQLSEEAVLWAELGYAQESLDLDQDALGSFTKSVEIAERIGLSRYLCESHPGWRPRGME